MLQQKLSVGSTGRPPGQPGDQESAGCQVDGREENKKGRPNMNRLRKQEAEHPIEEVGKKLREMMSYLGKGAAAAR